MSNECKHCTHRTRMVEETTVRYLCKTERMLRQRDDEIERLGMARMAAMHALRTPGLGVEKAMEILEATEAGGE